MATIKEIAKVCKVSAATVSKIINGKPGASEATKELVLRVAEEMNYTPNVVAQNLKNRSTKSIGVIAEDMTIFSIPDIIDGITEQCEEEGYHILLTNLRLFKKYNDKYYNRDDYFGLINQEIKKLMSKQVEGIIYVSAHERVMECIPENLSIPAVMAYGYTNSKKVPSIVVDDEHGAYEVVKNVLDRGHKKIGVITGKKDSMHAQARIKGYQKALYDARVLYDPDLLYTGDWTRLSGYKYTDQLLENGVTAIFCMNDLMAGGVYDRLEELGLKVGKDISVVGYDNRELSSYYKPALTTVELPLHDIGYMSSKVIMQMLSGDLKKEEETIIQVPCLICERDSVQLVK